MLSSITAIFPQAKRLRELAGSVIVKRFRGIVALCLGLIIVDLFVYALATTRAEARLVHQRERYRDLKKQYADAVLFRKQKEILKGLQSGIPTQKDVPILIRDLVQTAKRLNLAVGAITSDIPQPGSGGLAMLTFSVPVSGTYGGIKRFIHEIETSDRVIGIQDLKLEGEKGTVKLQMKLVTYIRSE